MPLAALLLGALVAPALADVPPEVAPEVEPVVPAGRELHALGLLQARITRSSVVSTNPFLDGQVVGSLGGLNGTTTSLDDRTMMAEQRATAFLSWLPGALDGRAGLTAGFEVDYGFGDQSYQVGGNKGGGFGADQVNLQTRRLYGSFSPRLGGGHELTVVAGLQFLSDGAYDPHKSSADQLFRHGGGLMLWGSEAAGVAAFGRLRTAAGDRLRYRLGGYTLLENGVGLPDDATLWAADVELRPTYAVDVGLHAWWLKDNTGGTGGTFGVGPSSQMSQLQGGPRLVYLGQDGLAAEVDADLLWLSADAGWNRDLGQGPVGARGLFLLNLGRLYVEGLEDVAVRGWLANGELRWRWARGRGSELSLQGLASSRDGDGTGAYTGVVTGNSYGYVGAVWATHGALLLFSDPMAINRQVAVVSDVSGGGRGLLAGTANLGFDPVPDRLTTTATLAHARTGDGQARGTEIGAAVVAHPWPLLDVGLRGAVVTGAQVEDPTTADLAALPAWPWAVLTHLQWVLF
ncbi:hypothetical protein L6R53_29305 [Myxococcota bacterium]|nr:hypothetical protein [Myxococcota bacterium]